MSPRRGSYKKVTKGLVGNVLADFTVRLSSTFNSFVNSYPPDQFMRCECFGDVVASEVMDVPHMQATVPFVFVSCTLSCVLSRRQEACFGQIDTCACISCAFELFHCGAVSLSVYGPLALAQSRAQNGSTATDPY